jgi:hypothetical protein
MNVINTFDRTTVLSELRRLVQKSLPIKGTYIKTLEKDDIFDKPVNKTSELQIVKVGNQSIYVPITKEPDVAEGAIPEDMLAKVVARIKDPKSRKILSAYLEQEKAQETTAKTIVKLEEAEGKNEDYQDIIDKKNDLVEKIKLAIDDADLQKILTDNNVNDFKKELGEAGLKYSLAGLSKTINATKKKLETNRLVAQARAQMAAQQGPTTRSRKQPPPPPSQPPNTLISQLMKSQTTAPQTPVPQTPVPPTPVPQTPVFQTPAAPQTPATPQTPAGATAHATNKTDLFDRLDKTLSKKSKIKIASVAQLDQFLVDNGYDELYKSGTAAEKGALSRARNKFINAHGLK